MSKKSSQFFFPTTFILSFIAVLGIGTVAFFLFEGSGSGQEKDIIIPRGTPISRVASLLAEEDVISRPKLFKILLRITNGAQRVRAGEYRFQLDMRPINALYVLYHDEPIVHQVTIPEGWNVYQVADTLTEAKLVDREEFLKLALSPKTAAEYSLKAPHMEGFLFPDTYFFSKTDGEKRIIDTMVKRFLSEFTEQYRKEARKMGFSLVQIVTLASIIEKETGVSEERELISSVFHNRLKKKMRLQSDPTTIYGIKDFDGNLTRAHLQEKTAYNTYKIRALPPGPIANPGKAALLAAISPADSDYLYFVANNQGGHVFSRTYAEHNDYVNTYQRRRGSRRSNSSTKNN